MRISLMRISEKIRVFIRTSKRVLAFTKGYTVFGGKNKKQASMGLEEKADSKRAALVKKEQQRLRAILDQRQAAEFYYHIDIVGTCNLRCPSCPVGNYTEPTPKGLMSIESYQKILEKIAREHAGENVFIDLYNWGESVLQKQLSEIIRITKEKGYGIGISTNLNTFPDMRRVIQASPSYIRISLSGYFNEVYQQTHKRGDINLVKSNMHLLRHLIDELKYEMEASYSKALQLYESAFALSPENATYMTAIKKLNLLVSA